MEELQTFYNKKKWYDLGQRVKTMATSSSEKHMIKDAINIYRRALKFMHPITSSEITILLYSFLSYNEAIELFNETINSIEKYNLSEKQRLDELLAVKMRACFCKIKNDNLENRESEIIEWKNLYKKEVLNTLNEKLCVKNIEFLNYLAYHFYISVKNVEEAQKYLFNYVFSSNDFTYIETLMKLSIISRDFFNFSAISTHPEFDSCKNKELKQLFLNFQNGNFAFINQNKDTLMNILYEFVNFTNSTFYGTFIMEKVYLINILNTCFITEDKFISFDKFINDLEIEESFLIILLIKALGIGIITGWIDSEQRMLFFDGILPRGLSDNDIENMKIKFIHWRNKVLKVIETANLEIK